jgi:sialic acid synthase SpsE
LLWLDAEKAAKVQKNHRCPKSKKIGIGFRCLFPNAKISKIIQFTEDQSVRFIADLSLNWQGLDEIKMVIQTVQADFVKLQYYSEYDLYGSGSKESKLDASWLPQIHEHCKMFRKKLMVTVFNPDHVGIIDPYVGIHKVASSEITDKDLLKQIKGCRKPVIVSCGGATRQQIGAAVEALAGLPITLMACNVEYPSKRHNVRHMLEIRNWFKGCQHGYSDHSLDIECFPILCSWYGAAFLEKHVKPNGNHPYEHEPHALTVEEFNEMVDTCLAVPKIKPKNPHQRIYDFTLKKWVRPRVI